ncbi:fructosamine kinase family protein [Alkalihalobacillus macyae]|uniref:fructosamine kinase family protein n=1 Tax=Guptibacillus hwajinpoensis TaxID=208199 RepID=UPI00273BC69A|nr:fructosamine kinase family protein [Alkalihalobacillus macyae]MDP4552250.1 fructosamine kinase family protein [Alkalihalobacillus macyae]
MKSAIEEAVKATGDVTPIDKCEAVSGGSINDTFYIKTGSQEYFAKLNRSAPEDFFDAEEKGLRLLEQNGIRVPKPLIILPRREQTEMVFLMEWIPSVKSRGKVDRALGSLVAEMHQKKASSVGLAESNYIGELHQPNHEERNWVSFFRDHRLGAIQKIAVEKGILSQERNNQLDKLKDNLSSLLGHNPDISLLHGDLWGGNWLESESGKPYLIDPAVYYGDREVDIAFTYLFGGYSTDFYAQYKADYPLQDGWKERMPIYQLYYLLVHLVLFGESYGSAVDRILKRYTT